MAAIIFLGRLFQWNRLGPLRSLHVSWSDPAGLGRAESASSWLTSFALDTLLEFS